VPSRRVPGPEVDTGGDEVRGTPAIDLDGGFFEAPGAVHVVENRGPATTVLYATFVFPAKARPTHRRQLLSRPQQPGDPVRRRQRSRRPGVQLRQRHTVAGTMTEPPTSATTADRGGLPPAHERADVREVGDQATVVRETVATTERGIQ
jgi:hypothetical protein